MPKNKLSPLPFEKASAEKLKAIAALRGFGSLNEMRREVLEKIAAAPMDSSSITITLEAKNSRTA